MYSSLCLPEKPGEQTAVGGAQGRVSSTFDCWGYARCCGIAHCQIPSLLQQLCRTEYTERVKMLRVLQRAIGVTADSRACAAPRAVAGTCYAPSGLMQRCLWPLPACPSRRLATLCHLARATRRKHLQMCCDQQNSAADDVRCWEFTHRAPTSLILSSIEQATTLGTPAATNAIPMSCE